jgi:hypothetical protein
LSVLALWGNFVVAEVIAVGAAKALAEGPLRDAWVGDLPSHTDKDPPSHRVACRGIGLLTALGASLVLWATIFVGVGWVLARVC